MGFIDAISGKTYRYNINIREPLLMLIQKLHEEFQATQNKNTLVALAATSSIHQILNPLVFENDPPFSEVHDFIKNIQINDGKVIIYLLTMYLIHSLENDPDINKKELKQVIDKKTILRAIGCPDSDFILYNILINSYESFPISAIYVLHMHNLLINKIFNFESELNNNKIMKAMRILEYAYFNFKDVLIKNGINEKTEENASNNNVSNDTVNLFIQLFEMVLDRQLTTINFLADKNYIASIIPITENEIKEYLSKKFPDEPKESQSLNSDNSSFAINAILIELQAFYLLPIDILMQEIGGIKAGRYLRNFICEVYRTQDWTEDSIINLLDHIELRLTQYHDILVKSDDIGKGFWNVVNKFCQTIFSEEYPPADAVMVLNMYFKTIYETIAGNKSNIKSILNNLQ